MHTNTSYTVVYCKYQIQHIACSTYSVHFILYNSACMCQIKFKNNNFRLLRQYAIIHHRQYASTNACTIYNILVQHTCSNYSQFSIVAVYFTH